MRRFYVPCRSCNKTIVFGGVRNGENLFCSERCQKQNDALRQQIDGIIDVASKWPGFKENCAAILDELAKGTEPLRTPQEIYGAVQNAYNAVMVPASGSAPHQQAKGQQQSHDRNHVVIAWTLLTLLALGAVIAAVQAIGVLTALLLVIALGVWRIASLLHAAHQPAPPSRS